MKYEEILSLHEYFLPVYVLTEERKDYWKQFVPNEKFYNVLSTALTAIESSSSPEKRKSLWLQGTYGTGKTHATAVVKHLLWDDLDDIADFLESVSNVQLRERLKSFRKQHKVFAVILKGVSNVTDIRSFALVIEKAVKDALKVQNIEISTKSDFEKMLCQVEENPAHIDWEKLIEESPDLTMYVNNKEEILDKLRHQNIKILEILESIVSTKGIQFSRSNISEWLSEVLEKLKEKDIAEFLMIYWDEFTSVLEQEMASSFLIELQNIAELKEKGVYVLVITHKIRGFSYLKNEEVEKILDRFHYLDYSMEPITTYHILGAAIKKVDREQWAELKKEKLEENDEILNLISRLVRNEGSAAENSVKNLFPIHPYTAYLATFIARNIGSTERSIFNFLYDKEKGFLNFIGEHPSDGEDFYLTSDYLWNFFVEDFERDNYEKFGSILDKHKLYVSKLEEKEAGVHYARVFKSILLLNTLHQVVKVSETESGLVSPSIENIRSMFLGTHQEEYVDEVLEYIDSAEIIQKTPDNLFLVATSTLPLKEVDDEKEKEKRKFEDITEILTSKQSKEIETIFTSLVLRKTEFKLFGAGIKEHILKSKLNNLFKENSSLSICVFIGRTVQEISKIKDILWSISTEDEFKNIIFVVVEDCLTEDDFDKFIEYKTRAVVSERHNFKEEKATNDNYAERVIDSWINKIKSGYVEWYLGDEKRNELTSRFGKCVNNELSGRVFSFGLEKLDGVRMSTNIWTSKYSKISVEIFLFANSRQDIEEKTSKGGETWLREIIKNNRRDYVVSESLEIKSEVDEKHPIVKMFGEVRKKIKNKKSVGVFHLGEELKFLSKPPYGLYTNMACMAAMGFLVRQFVGLLYESGTGRPLEKDMMRDKILSLFKYWQEGKDSNKLEVRFGTGEEKELIGILKEVFKLQDVVSLNDVKWKIREWIKEVEYPLWTFKVSCNNDKTKNSIDKIVWLIKSIDREINQNDIIDSLNSIKDTRYDLTMQIKREKAKGLFTKWLKRIENVNIKDEKVESVVKFLNQNMQEEVVSWDEDRVREKVKDWEIKKIKNQQPESKKDGDEVEVETEHPQIEIQGHPQKVNGEREERIKQKIINYSGNTKELLIKLIDKHPELCEWFEENLE